ncbi:MAG: amidohydrolase family protein [Alphaproteobacteria bacterium]|nr:amidohydrolase family protein [Alphaproteobacteria bacterium]
MPQTADQKKVERRIKELADIYGAKLGMNRRQFLQSSCGMAAAFLAMNDVFGPVFNVSEAEAADPELTLARADSLSNQFIFDDQTHFVHDDFEQEGILGLGVYAAENWNPALDKSQLSLYYYKFENYVRQIFFNSDTKVALLSGAPFDDPAWWLLPNDAIMEAVRMVNHTADSRRMLGHFVVTPGQDGWMDEVDRAIAEVHPDAWKSYTIGDPLSAATKYPWFLDDEKLTYAWYEKAMKSGIRNIACHKGLMPADYEQSWAGVWEYQTPRDIAKAAKDWPDLNFIIYHGCLRPFMEDPANMLATFEKTGDIEWSSELARIPQEHGVTNVYAELGTTFAQSATASPRFAAALLGTFIKGMGADHVVWGSDSLWYGSPQWQIEALRRLEIPEDIQKKHGFAPLGGADSFVKNAIFGGNSARLFNLDLRADYSPMHEDKFAEIQHEYKLAGGIRSKPSGYIAKQTA